MIRFVHPHFLWFFLGLILPLILHLLNRRQNRRIVFPTISFLQKTSLPREGRQRLQDVLLLLLRLLLLSLLILLLARPVWEQAPARIAHGKRPRLCLLLLDQSASMQAPSARKALTEILQSRLPDDNDIHWGLITCSSRAQMPIAPRPGNLPAILRLLNSKESAPGFLKGDPDPALRLASAQLRQFDGDKELMILTDCQSSNWEKISAPLPRDTRITFFPELQLPRSNAGILQVFSAPLQKNRIRLSVLVRNYSSSPLSTTLSVRLGDRTEKQSLQLPANEQLPVVFVFEQTQPQMQGTAILAPDALPFDNQFSFWAGHPAPEQVLLVTEQSDENSPMTAMETYFLQQALTTEQDGRFQQYQPRMIPAATLFAVNYSDYKQIFLLGTAETITQADWEKLKQFVQKGGLLFITPGPSPQTAFHHLRQAGITRAVYRGTIGSDSRQAGLGIGWVNQNSILGKLFPEKALSDLFLFPIRRYIHISLPDESNREILLKTLDGRPALTAWNTGLGRVYCFSFGFSPQWSDFALSQSFLPLIRELCSGGNARRTVSTQLYCGQPRPRFFQLNGEEIDKDKVIDNLRPGTASIGPHLIEYHPDPDESKTECSTPEALVRFLQKTDATEQQPTSVAVQPPQNEFPLWKIIAAVLMGLLLTEALCMIHCDRKFH